MEVLEVISILPQMEKVIHVIGGIAIQRFLYFGQQTVIAELSFHLIPHTFHLM